MKANKLISILVLLVVTFGLTRAQVQISFKAGGDAPSLDSVTAENRSTGDMVITTTTVTLVHDPVGIDAVGADEAPTLFPNPVVNSTLRLPGESTVNVYSVGGTLVAQARGREFRVNLEKHRMYVIATDYGNVKAVGGAGHTGILAATYGARAENGEPREAGFNRSDLLKSEGGDTLLYRDGDNIRYVGWYSGESDTVVKPAGGPDTIIFNIETGECSGYWYDGRFHRAKEIGGVCWTIDDVNMGGGNDSVLTRGEAKSVCRNGWHLATVSDWVQLIEQASADFGPYEEEVSFENAIEEHRWYTASMHLYDDFQGHGTNDYGFDVYIGDVYPHERYYWTPTNGITVALHYIGYTVYDLGDDYEAASARCVKD